MGKIGVILLFLLVKPYLSNESDLLSNLYYKLFLFSTCEALKDIEIFLYFNIFIALDKFENYYLYVQRNKYSLKVPII